MESATIILDRERNLRYSWADIRDLCRVMTRLEPGEFPRKVTQGRLWQLLVDRDTDAITQTLFHGMRWEDRTLKAERVDQMIGEFIAGGGDMGTIYDAIADAWIKSGIVRPATPPSSENGASGNGATAPGS